MSWFIGLVGKNIPDANESTVLSFRKPALYSCHVKNKLSVIAGGNNDTLHCTQSGDSVSLIAGIGIHRSDSSSQILSTEQWSQLLLQDDVEEIRKLNGHFAIISYKNDTLKCFSDRVGLRTLYFGKTEHGWMFSTCLAWLAKFIPHTKINWKVFGSHWLYINQFSFESPVENTKRLPPNGTATIRNDELNIQSAPWIQTLTGDEAPGNTIKILRSLANPKEEKVKLCLSGGLDSRVLLSILTSNSQLQSTCAFGNENDPDVVFARHLSERENIPFTFISSEFPSRDECLRLFQNYVEKSNLAEGAASSVRLRHYSALKETALVVIDGGNGEIARRQFLNTLLFKARKFIATLQADKMLPFLTLHRADIFNNNALTIMHGGAAECFDASLRLFPAPSEIGVENFLDMWTAQIRIPNVACNEQARFDECTLNFMPYSQPDFILSALNLPLRFRKNNILFKDIINSFRPSLTRYPLIKNDISYPYRLTTLQARVWRKIKARFMKGYGSSVVHLFLEMTQEYVLDTLHSSSTQTYPYYDYKKIHQSVHSYYNGDKSFANEVNWWLAFDLWRRMVEK